MRRARQWFMLTNIENTLRQQEQDDAVGSDDIDTGNDESREDDEFIEDADVAEDGLTGSIEDVLQTVAQKNDEVNIDVFCRMNWRDDAGERGRRIYEWWRVAMNERRDVIPSFYKAIRLALTQASSAAVERVFSQLTYIRRVVGDSTVREMLELRALFRCSDELLSNDSP